MYICFILKIDTFNIHIEDTCGNYILLGAKKLLSYSISDG